MARSEFISRPHYDAAHLHPLNNVPTKNQLPATFDAMDENTRL